jgi:hypothetical protein
MRRSLISVSLAAFVVLMLPANALAALPNHLPNLGAAGNFAILAGTTLTANGLPSWVSGRVGVGPPGSAVTGFPPSKSGPQQIPATTAHTNLTAAYVDAAAQSPFTNLPVELGGLTLKRGTYRQGTAFLTGILNLDGGGSSTGVWIFQIGSTLKTGNATGARVHLINGAEPCDIFWQVGSSATIGSSAAFVGNIMALTSISMAADATLEGRALARGGAVTLIHNRIIQPGGCGYNAPSSVAGPSGTTLPASLGFSLFLPVTGVPAELRGEFPWLLVLGIAAGAGAATLGLISRRRRRRTA